MKFENTEVSVIKSKRKTISIQVKPNEVIIRAPMKMKEKEIEMFAVIRCHNLTSQYSVKNHFFTLVVL